MWRRGELTRSTLLYARPIKITHTHTQAQGRAPITPGHHAVAPVRILHFIHIYTRILILILSLVGCSGIMHTAVYII